MSETEWFEEKREGEHGPRLIIPALLWFFAIVGVIVGALVLTSCAQTFTGLCTLKPIGMTEHGHAVVATYCEAS